jgi:hypothetical protein
VQGILAVQKQEKPVPVCKLEVCVTLYFPLFQCQYHIGAMRLSIMPNFRNFPLVLLLLKNIEYIEVFSFQCFGALTRLPPLIFVIISFETGLPTNLRS